MRGAFRCCRSLRRPPVQRLGGGLNSPQRRFDPACGRGASGSFRGARKIRLKRSGKGSPDTNPVSRKAGRVFCCEDFADGILCRDDRRQSRPIGAWPIGWRRRRAPRALRHAAAARLRPLAAAIRARLRNVRHARRGARERGARLPRAQRIASRRRLLRGRPRQHRLVGQHGRPRKAARHRPLFRRRRQQPRELLRIVGTALREPRDRQFVGRRLSARHRRRLGRCAGAARRPAGHPAVGRGDGRQPGRDAGARVGDALPRPDPPRAGDRRGAESFRAEHRLQRSRAPGDPHATPIFTTATSRRRGRSRGEGSSWRG